MTGRFPALRGACLNTATLGHREPLEVVADRVARAGFGCITPWRRDVDERHASRAARVVQAAGLRVSGYCRTTAFAHDTGAARAAAIDDNQRGIETAATLGASSFVAVVGGLAASSRDIEAARGDVLRGIEALMPTLQATGIRLLLEPLHPFYAADRSVLNTLAQARAWCDELDPGDRWLGIVVDAYHVWWDPALERSIEDAGRRIRALHVCDWLRNTQDPLLDRGMMGDGVIDLRALRSMVERCGFGGPLEVEIFSKNRWWQEDPDVVLRTCLERLVTAC